MFDEGLMDKSDLCYIQGSRAKLLFVQGKYTESLEQTNKTIETAIKSGLSLDDLFIMGPYLLKIEIFNYLEEYQQAYAQAKKLYNLCEPCKKEAPEIFGRIYTQMARSELGLGELDQASEHVNKAISIFLADERRNPKNTDYSEDPNLADSYVVQGDILFAQDNVKEAIESYNKSYIIIYIEIIVRMWLKLVTYIVKEPKLHVKQETYIVINFLVNHRSRSLE